MKTKILLLAAILFTSLSYSYSQINNYDMYGNGSPNQILQVDKLDGGGVGGVQHLIMKPSVISEYNSFIGIGVSQPSEKLHVAGNILADDDIYGTNISGNIKTQSIQPISLPNLISISADPNNSRFLLQSNGDFSFGHINESYSNTNGLFEIKNYNSSVFAFSINSESKGLIIQTNSDVPSMDIPLEVRNINGLNTFHVTGAGDVYFKGDLSQNGNLIKPSKWQEQGNDLYYLDGAIGIGTDLPSATLDVVGTLRVAAPAIFEESINFWTNGGSILNVNSIQGLDHLSFRGDSGDTDFYIDSDGNVGIGTVPNSLTKFHIQDDFPSIQLRSTTAHNYNGVFINHSESGGHYEWFAGTPQDNAHNFIIACQQTSNHNPSTATSANAKITISDEGWVGIGTAPEWETELTVNGEIKATTLNVDYFNTGDLTINDELSVTGLLTAGEILVVGIDKWKDEVFYDDYSLLQLSKVEQYVKENHHLPDIPSEAEVLDKGINVAEMNALLLQKIEELTLYIIDQEKRIINLENN